MITHFEKLHPMNSTYKSICKNRENIAHLYKFFRVKILKNMQINLILRCSIVSVLWINTFVCISKNVSDYAICTFMKMLNLHAANCVKKIEKSVTPLMSYINILIKRCNSGKFNKYILWFQIYVEFINMDGSKGIATIVCQQCSAWRSVYDHLINVSQQQKFEIQKCSDYL